MSVDQTMYRIIDIRHFSNCNRLSISVMYSFRLLVGGKLNVHMNPPEVIASIVKLVAVIFIGTLRLSLLSTLCSEKQARALLSSEVDPT